MTTPPIACSLSAVGRAERAELVAALASDALLARARVRGSLLLRFRRAAGVEERVRAWAALEAECCPFLTLVVHVHGPAVILRIDGPPEAAAIIDELLPVTPEAPLNGASEPPVDRVWPGRRPCPMLRTCELLAEVPTHPVVRRDRDGTAGAPDRVHAHRFGPSPAARLRAPASRDAGRRTAAVAGVGAVRRLDLHRPGRRDVRGGLLHSLRRDVLVLHDGRGSAPT